MEHLISFTKYYSNTTLVKVKWRITRYFASISLIQIQHLLKLNENRDTLLRFHLRIQIQHLLKLNPVAVAVGYAGGEANSNTTLVKVKY